MLVLCRCRYTPSTSENKNRSAQVQNIEWLMANRANRRQYRTFRRIACLLERFCVPEVCAAVYQWQASVSEQIAMLRFFFITRDILWLTLLVAICCTWWLSSEKDKRREAEYQKMQQQYGEALSDLWTYKNAAARYGITVLFREDGEVRVLKDGVDSAEFKPSP